VESEQVIAAFRRGLGEAGFSEGRNVAIEYRWADGRYDQLPILAADLVATRVAIVVAAGGPPAALAAKAATSTIPVVFSSTSDPIALGLVASLNRPGGNVTGMAPFMTLLGAKCLELLKELKPASAVMAYLSNPSNPAAELGSKEALGAATALGIRLHILNASTDQELDEAFAALAKLRADGLVVPGEPFFDSQRNRIVALAAQYSVALAATALPATTRAQQSTKLASIGFLGPAPAANFAPLVDALRVGLRELGYTEGKDLTFSFRWWQAADQLPELAAELVRAEVDLLFAPSSAETAVFLAATKTVPIVFSTHGDPVGIGHVASLARPGGNATGLTTLLTELVAKELEAFKEALPLARRVGVLFASTTPLRVPALATAKTTARRLGVELREVPVSVEEDFQGGFAKMTQEGVDGCMVLSSPLMISRRELLAELALRHRLPSMFGAKENVLAGGLMSYAPDALDLNRRAATHVHRILRGAKPANLPVEQPVKFELVINLRTAKALGLEVPLHLQQRADEVIE
jgi:putative ABC transport system substrate-binding protein